MTKTGVKGLPSLKTFQRRAASTSKREASLPPSAVPRRLFSGFNSGMYLTAVRVNARATVYE